MSNLEESRKQAMRVLGRSTTRRYALLSVAELLHEATSERAMLDALAMVEMFEQAEPSDYDGKVSPKGVGLSGSSCCT